MSTLTYHWHHIIPKHAGGSDDPSNLIRLTVPEHAEAHRLLYEQYGRIGDKIAWKLLSGKTDDMEADFRELYRQGGLQSRGRKLSAETRAKIGTANRGNRRPDLAEYNRQTKRGVPRGPQSSEHRAKRAAAQRAFFQTPEGIAARKRSSERMKAHNPSHRQ